MGESAAALLKDGVVVAAAEEERFTRIKHEGCFPIRSIRFCLEQEGIALSDIDHIAVYWQPWRVKTRALGVLKAAARSPRSLGAKLARSAGELRSAGAGDHAASQGSWIELFRVRAILQRHFGLTKARVHYLDHHRCHMASAFYASPFEEATVLTIDGAGEEFATTLAVGQGLDLRVLKEIPWPNSLGHFYSAMTGFLGLGMLDGEYKLMGLAPYRSATFITQLRESILRSNGEGDYHLNTAALDYHAALRGEFSRELTDLLGPARDPGEEFSERHQEIAASVQAAFEQVVSELARWAYDHGAKSPNLVIAGGCGLNCTANGKLLRDGPFDALYVPSAPHDAGCAIGAALLVEHELLRMPRRSSMTHAYYGPRFSNEQITAAMRDEGLQVAASLTEDELVARTADVLAGGGIVGWFQGAMEFGPRALGGRSFLADPRNDAIREVMNEKIKKRELFRPFAPSVKRESASEYFDTIGDSPFMNVIVPVRSAKRSVIPAVTHVDGTARIQTVSKETNPRYWKLLDQFERRTDVPVLLNTSFNIQEPIVCTPSEAIRTFRRSQVDALCLGDHLIRRDALGKIS